MPAGCETVAQNRLGGVSVEQVVTGDVAVSSPALRAVLECIPGPVEPPGKVRLAGT